MHQRYKSIMWLSSSPARSVLTINPASPHSGRRRQAWWRAPTLVRTFYRRDLSHRVIKNHGAHKPHTDVGYTRAAGSTPIRFHCNFTCAVAPQVLIITIRIERWGGALLLRRSRRTLREHSPIDAGSTNIPATLSLGAVCAHDDAGNNYHRVHSPSG